MRHLIEPLEQRTLLSVEPNVFEQYLLTLVNRARLDPALEAARFGIALNEGVPASATISPATKPPLAFNFSLNSAARAHSQWMLDTNTFSHTGAGGSSPGDRDAAAGYVFVPPSGWGENLAYYGVEFNYPDIVATVERLHRNLFVDEGIDDRGHRVTMLQDYWTESGVGLVGGVFSSPPYDYMTWMLTNEFATTAGDRFLTGVVFADTITQDNFYSPYEGLGQVTIEATHLGTDTLYTTHTWDAGGYSLQLPPGEYHVRAHGGDLLGVWDHGIISMGADNVLMDINATGFAEMPQLLPTGVLLASGTHGHDVIRVLDLGDRLRYERNGGTIDFARHLVSAIEIHAGDGNDYVEIDGGLVIITGIYGGGGNDTILGGAGTDYIDGGDGDDYINGRFGDDSIHGGDGHDLLEGRAGNDTLFGGRGRDTLLGGNHHDYLFGGKGGDYLDGGNGNDTLIGGAMIDQLFGGNGDDWIYADDGEVDFIDGGNGRNFAVIDPLLDVAVNVLLV